MPRGKATNWKPQALAKLGKVPDSHIAAELGISACTVSDFRLRLGIAAAPASSRSKSGPKDHAATRHRRTISVSRKTYFALVERCAALGVSCSSTVETLVNNHLDKLEGVETKADQEMVQARGY